jgi:hypothetical protein
MLTPSLGKRKNFPFNPKESETRRQAVIPYPHIGLNGNPMTECRAALLQAYNRNIGLSAQTFVATHSSDNNIVFRSGGYLTKPKI